MILAIQKLAALLFVILRLYDVPIMRAVRPHDGQRKVRGGRLSGIRIIKHEAVPRIHGPFLSHDGGIDKS